MGRDRGRYYPRGGVEHQDLGGATLADALVEALTTLLATPPPFEHLPDVVWEPIRLLLPGLGDEADGVVADLSKDVDPHHVEEAESRARRAPDDGPRGRVDVVEGEASSSIARRVVVSE